MTDRLSFDEVVSTKSTYSKVSFDKEHDKAMIDSEIETIDFDEVKEKYYRCFNAPNSDCASADALEKVGDQFYLIEFKNGDLKNQKTRSSVRKKMKDSIYLLSDILDCKISDVRNRTTAIVVYNEKVNILKHLEPLAHKAGKEQVFFGLEKCKELYVKDVKTIDRNEFKEFIHDLKS